ncbi:MAG: glucose-6-phosphate isomerase [Acidobacteriota bacterium]|nr:glucose-6-phosphate isomerase [Acidobacteriota bacterium]
MSNKVDWDTYRRWLYSDRDLGLRVDLSHMGIDDAYVERLRGRFETCFDGMVALESGSIANPDEDRMVGHYWLRDPSLAPTETIQELIRSTVTDVDEFAARVRDGELRTATGQRFTDQLIVGIGGSALGPQFVAQALGTREGGLEPHFLDNSDPDGIDRVLGGLGRRLETTLVIVISKSGGTPETRNGMLETEAALRARGVSFGGNSVAITQEGSRLDRFALDKRFLARFPMWDWVGGRTSQTSAVGLLPAALQGHDIREFLAGAASTDRVTRRHDLGANPAALLALAWHHAGNGRGEKDMVLLPYKDRLALLSRYLQQLVMESLGKERDLNGETVHQGIAVYGNKGSTDQHAYVQQLRDGVKNFFVTFVEVLEEREGDSLEVEEGITCGDYLHGFLLGTRQALYENGRPSLTITIDRVGERQVGMLIALYERAVGLYAGLIRVNAYHQPGVEAGKKAAAAVLQLQSALVAALDECGDEGATAEQLAVRLDRADQVTTIFELLERLAANARSGVRSEPTSPIHESRYRRG